MSMPSYTEELPCMSITGCTTVKLLPLHRPGLIGPHTITGHANVQDWVCWLVRGLAKMGTYPVGSGCDGKEIRWTPVDQVARAVVHLSLQHQGMRSSKGDMGRVELIICACTLFKSRGCFTNLAVLTHMFQEQWHPKGTPSAPMVLIMSMHCCMSDCQLMYNFSIALCRCMACFMKSTCVAYHVLFVIHTDPLPANSCCISHLVNTSSPVTFTEVAETMKNLLLPNLTTCG